MSSIIQVTSPATTGSELRDLFDGNFAARHSWDITAISGTYTVLAADQCIVANAAGGAFTITLPTAASAVNRSIVFIAKSVAGGNITIDGAGAETINGAATLVISVQYTVKRLVSDGTTWFAW